MTGTEGDDVTAESFVPDTSSDDVADAWGGGDGIGVEGAHVDGTTPAMVPVLGPGGTAGVPVEISELLLDDVDHLLPGIPLIGSLQRLTSPESVACCPDAAPPAVAGRGLSHGAHSPLDHIGDEDLRRVVAGWEKVISWARAAQARVAAALMARTDGPLARDSVAGEVADELRATTTEGWQIAARGEGARSYPALARALATGEIDTRKADTFLRAGNGLTPAERGEAITDLLPGARDRTWRWISEQMNARAATLHGTKARRRQIVDRCNVWAEQAGPGMGRITADLPVVETARAFNTIQAAAKALRDVPGESRPLGALRAAAFTALVTGDLVLPDPTRRADPTRREGPGDHEEQGDVVRPGELPGPHRHEHTGPMSDAVAPPHPGTLERLVTPVLDTDLMPLPATASAATVRLTRPATPCGRAADTHPGTGTDRRPDTDTDTRADTGNINHDECAERHGDVMDSRRAHRAADDHTERSTRIRVIDVAATVQVTVPATMLLDPEDLTPGVLDGIGPIPADAAARLATDATWRRLLTDPVTGVLTDYSSRSYAPGAVLRAAVDARDGTCRFPGCHRPARVGGRAAADLDHIAPFDHARPERAGEAGQTRAANLHVLCRTHHNLKTHGGWNVSRSTATGVTRWTPPSGTATTVSPAVTDPTIRYALARGMTLAEQVDPPGSTASSKPPGSDTVPPPEDVPGIPPF